MLLMVEEVEYIEVMGDLVILKYQDMVEVALLTLMVVEMVEEVEIEVVLMLAAVAAVLVDILVLVVKVDIKELVRHRVHNMVKLD